MIIQMPPLEPIREPTIGKSWKYWIALKMKRKYRFTDDWICTLHNGVRVRIRKGEETDGASVPWWGPVLMAQFCIHYVPGWAQRFFNWLDLPFAEFAGSVALTASLALIGLAFKMMFSAMGLALIAACIHDPLYEHGYLELEDGTRYMDGCSSWEADRLFRHLHIHTNDMPGLAWVTWFFMILGSWAVWYPRKFKNWRAKRKT